MSKHIEVISKEIDFHDSIAEGIKVNNDLLKKYLSYDSPGIHIADSLPRLKARLSQALGDVAGLRVLVYGCGNDAAALWFAKSGAIVDAIDISPRSIENQQLIAASTGFKFNAVVMDAHDLKFPSDSYDIVYGNAILHHLAIKQAAREIYRVLKPEGKGIFRDVMKGNVFLQAFRFATPFWRTKDEHPLTTEDFEFLSESFSKVQIDCYMLWGLPYIFSVRMINVILKNLKLKTHVQLSNSICAIFDKIDGVFFRILPFMKNQAWICLITLTK